jgi:hypothetical protein
MTEITGAAIRRMATEVFLFGKQPSIDKPKSLSRIDGTGHYKGKSPQAVSTGIRQGAIMIRPKSQVSLPRTAAKIQDCQPIGLRMLDAKSH